jgi:hypothetical protein
LAIVETARPAMTSSTWSLLKPAEVNVVRARSSRWPRFSVSARVNADSAATLESFGMRFSRIASTSLQRPLVRLMFNPNGLRPYVSNWEAVAETLIQRVHREAVGGIADAATEELLAEVLAYPDVPKRLHRLDLSTPSVPVIPVCFRKGEHAFNFFSTVTTLGTPQDVTLQELRIECFYPSDKATEERARALP